VLALCKAYHRIVFNNALRGLKLVPLKLTVNPLKRPTEASPN
jgi:hypothetical protein